MPRTALRYVLCLCGLVLGWVASAPAAEFVISPLRVTLSRAVKSTQIEVRNADTRPLRVQVDAMAWSQDAEGKDHYAESDALLFFPKAMEIPAGGSRIVRLAAKVPPASVEDTYRLFIAEPLVGNDTFNRYLDDAGRIHCQSSLASTRKYSDLVSSFKRFGKEYGFDWLMLAAQGYQESRLRQDAQSSTGAVGIMQLRPSTAADPNVGIPDISSAEDNIHAGAKYMRFLADRYFGDDLDPLQQWLLTLAAYNAGPARVAQLRGTAGREGYDPDRWFNNVEIIAARQIGAETVGYVSNVYKYFVGYKLAQARTQENAEKYGVASASCDNAD